MKFRLVLAGLLAIGSGDLAAAATKDVKAKHLQNAAKAKMAHKKIKPDSQSAAEASADHLPARTETALRVLPSPHEKKSAQAVKAAADATSADAGDGHDADSPAAATPTQSRHHDKHHKVVDTQPPLVDQQDPMVATRAATAVLDTADLKTVERATDADVDTMISRYAARYEVPESLVRRVVKRESQFHPSLRNGPYWGLMQIRPDTARGMGYHGAPAGLLNAATNLNYAVPYLANAWRLAGGSEARAIQLYAGGYYYVAKRRGMLDQMIKSAGQVE
jgi:soluble lytic murein transglycosylase-like protein